ncbi:MAG: CARDB domain-containing protein [Nitrososphaerota archaeon]
MPSVASQPIWPSDTQWIWIDYDKNEDGPQDDWRDVKNAYYYYDGTYLYLRLECYATPGSKWPADNARYKWFINITQVLYMSGGNIIGAKYLLFVEDTDDDGTGEIYLLKDIILDGKFDEYGPGQAYDYRNYKITDPTNATFRITGNYIDMKVKWASIGNPTSYGLMWATDQENPNLNQAPTTDHPDEEIGLVIHDVVAVNQWANVTEVEQGKFVKVTVEIENRGTSSESFDVTAYFGPRVTCVKRVVNLPAGQTTTVEFDCPTEGVEPGVYVIRAFVDSAGEILEIDEDNNWCTAPASVTVKVHDVAAISQDANPTVVTQGESITINVVVKNLGNYTETFDVTIYYDSTPIGTQIVNNLAPGDQTTVSFNWDTTGVTPEIYFIKAFVDSARAINEFNEVNNNCTAITPVIVRPPAQLGISVEKAIARVVSGPDPPIAGIQTVYEIKIIVTNTGNVPLLKVNVTDSTWNIDWRIASLDPGHSSIMSFNYGIIPSSSGVFTLNRGQDLTATGRTEDYQYVSDTADLDLVVTAYTRDVVAVSQTPTKTTVIQGELVGIDVVVKNAGDYYGETFNVTLYYSSDGTTWTKIKPIDTIRVFGLGVNEEITLRFVWDTEAVPPGTYYIRAAADSGNELPETFENNNVCIQEAVIEIQVHDIVAVSQGVSATSVMSGRIVKITGLLRNDGSETETFTVRCYYGRPEIPLVQIESDQTITLAPGEQTSVSFYWDTSGVTPGAYWIEVRVLPVVGELDTYDNTCTVETSVTIKAYYVGGEIIAPPAISIINIMIVAILVAALVTVAIFLFKNRFWIK